MCYESIDIEWWRTLKEDYAVVQQLQHGQNPIYNAICFHAQQCVEKYLKAWLQEANIPFPRTHDLKELLELIVPSVPIWQVWEPDFSIAFQVRCSDSLSRASATADDAEYAVHICDTVRRSVREQLKLPVEIMGGLRKFRLSEQMCGEWFPRQCL